MDRRTFLKAVGASVVGGPLAMAGKTRTPPVAVIDPWQTDGLFYCRAAATSSPGWVHFCDFTTNSPLVVGDSVLVGRDRAHRNQFREFCRV